MASIRISFTQVEEKAGSLEQAMNTIAEAVQKAEAAGEAAVSGAGGSTAVANAISGCIVAPSTEAIKKAQASLNQMVQNLKNVAGSYADANQNLVNKIKAIAASSGN